MAYIGNKADAAFTSLLKQDLTGASGQTLTLSHAIANENDIALALSKLKNKKSRDFEGYSNEIFKNKLWGSILETKK